MKEWHRLNINLNTLSRDLSQQISIRKNLTSTKGKAKLRNFQNCVVSSSVFLLWVCSFYCIVVCCRTDKQTCHWMESMKWKYQRKAIKIMMHMSHIYVAKKIEGNERQRTLSHWAFHWPPLILLCCVCSELLCWFFDWRYFDRIRSHKRIRDNTFDCAARKAANAAKQNVADNKKKVATSLNTMRLVSSHTLMQ